MSNARPLSRGVHHLALNTDDMKMTLDFYVGVLGMPLVHALKVPPGLGTGPGNRGNPPFENLRHYFLDAGGDTLLAFFEMPKGVKHKGDRDCIGTMQHVSFAVSEQRFHRSRRRSRKRTCPTSARSTSAVTPGPSTSTTRTASGSSSRTRVRPSRAWSSGG